MKDIKGSYNLIKTGSTWGMEKSYSLVEDELEDVFLSMLVEARANELGMTVKEYCDDIVVSSEGQPLTFL